MGCSSKHTGESALTMAPQKVTIIAGTWVGNLDKATITVSLSKDGRFQTVFRGGKHRSVVKGRASLEGSYVRLEPTEFNGAKPKLASQKEQVKFKFSSDWATLTSESGLSLARKI
ncbi:MAG: hypothetical protein H7Y17_10950 [Chlorobia bacterium]|nr:hypothetical protein [Fimbriimonadaceae bacterium]